MSERLDTRARKVLELREEASMKQADADRAKAQRDRYEAEFWAALEDENTKTWTGDVGAPYGQIRITRRSTPRSRVLNKQALIKALRERGLAAAMLRPEPNKKALNAYVKTLQETGEPLPEGLDFYDDKGLTVTILKK